MHAKTRFVALEKCVEDADKNGTQVQKEFCLDEGVALGKCMEALIDYYYEPALKIARV